MKRTISLLFVGLALTSFHLSAISGHAQTVSPSIDEAKFSTARSSGVFVTEVFKNGPADGAGLQAGDVIVEMAGGAIASEHAAIKQWLGFAWEGFSEEASAAFTHDLQMLAPGQSVRVTVERKAERIQLTLVPMEKPKALKETTEKFLSTIEKGDTALSAGNFTKAFEHYERALELSVLIGSPSFTGFAKLRIGDYYSALNSSEFDSKALQAYSEAVQHYEMTKNYVGIAIALDTLGRQHFVMSQYAQVVDVLNRALIASGKAALVGSKESKLQALQRDLLTLDVKARSHERLGEFTQQEECYRQLAATYSAFREGGGGVPPYTLRAQEELGYARALTTVGDYDAALAVYEMGLKKLYEQSKEDVVYLVPGVYFEVGKIYRLLGQPEKALENFYQSASRYRTLLKGSPQEAEALFQIGEVYQWNGHSEEAIQSFLDAQTIYRELKMVSKNVEARGAIAGALASIGDFLGARQWFALGEDALFLESEGLRKWFVRRYSEGNAIDMSLTEELAFLRDKRTIEKQLKLVQQWDVEPSQKDQFIQELSQVVATIPPDLRRAAGRLYRTHAVLFLADQQSLLTNPKVVDLAKQALDLAIVYHRSIAGGREQKIELAQDLYYLGLVHFAQKDFDLALEALESAEELALSLRTPEIHRVYALLAITHVTVGNRELGIAYFEKAIKEMELILTSQFSNQFRMGTMEAAVLAYWGYETVLLELYRITGDQAYLSKAFEISERGRAQSFLEQLTKARFTPAGSAAGTIAEEDRKLQQQIAHVYSRLQLPRLSESDENRLLGKLDKLRKELQAVQAKLAPANPQFGLGRLSGSITLKDVQSVLDEDSILLQYSAGLRDSGTVLWAITKDNVRIHTLKDHRRNKEVLDRLLEFVRMLQAPLIDEREASQYMSLAELMYELLLEPAEQELRGKKHLIIAPIGALFYVPFEALIIPSPAKEKSASLAEAHYVLQQYAVSYVPSASVMVLQRQKAKTAPSPSQYPVLVIGDALYKQESAPISPDVKGASLTELSLRDFTLQPLPFSGEEVRRIAEVWGALPESDHVYLRAKASAKRIQELDLSRYRILHFATHAILPGEIQGATEPALVLSPDTQNGQQSMLKFSDILNLKLNAELVVLSACNTRLGRFRLAEGIIAMTRAFLYAGADAVVVSLWKVADQATSVFMQRFHQGLKAGKAKVEALRQAKRDLLKEKLLLRATGISEPLASPFYWAPFVLIGQSE